APRCTEPRAPRGYDRRRTPARAPCYSQGEVSCPAPLRLIFCCRKVTYVKLQHDWRCAAVVGFGTRVSKSNGVRERRSPLIVNRSMRSAVVRSAVVVALGVSVAASAPAQRASAAGHEDFLVTTLVSGLN